MVTYLILHKVRRASNRLFALSNQPGSLCQCILTGLGMFGLAVNGMCLAAPAHSLPEASKSDLPAGR
jgi:hypothetical protein